MASLASVSSFTGLKVQSLKPAGVRSASTSSSGPATVVCSAAGSPWQRVGKALVATGAGLMLATSAATAATVKLGTDTGALEFEPSKITVKAGEEIVFANNKGFPHNVVFDEENVPAGVAADKISFEDLMNSPSETFKVKLTVPGTYSVYCEPHQGAGMSATITVE